MDLGLSGPMVNYTALSWAPTKRDGGEKAIIGLLPTF